MKILLKYFKMLLYWKVAQKKIMFKRNLYKQRKVKKVCFYWKGASPLKIKQVLLLNIV